MNLTDLQANLVELFPTAEVVADCGEVSLIISAESYLNAALTLRDHTNFQFEQLIDLCGVDYSEFQADRKSSNRFSVVSHLLSVSLNQRLRLEVRIVTDSQITATEKLPSVDSIAAIWPAAIWYEREAFDLYGIIFLGHNDLRRILTDYGFVGHPFRKDFPVSGFVEIHYDQNQKRVVYQPVSIQKREITPRIVRERHFAGTSR